MKVLGNAENILGMRISRNKKDNLLSLSQEKYIEKELKRFNMVETKSLRVPLPSYHKLSKADCPRMK